jgi:hypothetical protein
MEAYTQINKFLKYAIFGFFILPPSYILIELGFVLGVPNAFLQALVIIIIFLTFQKITPIKPTKLQKHIIIVYFLFILYFITLLFSYYAEDPELQMKLLRVHVKNLVVGLMIFSIIVSPKINFDKLNILIVNIAVFFSILSLILYFGYLLRAIPLSYYELEGLDQLFARGWIFGYLNVIVKGIPRNQSFYSEAGLFAQTLQIPIAISFYYYRMKIGRNMLIKLLILLLAFILTFSLANIFGIMFALGLGSLFSMVKTRSFIKIVGSLVLLIALTYGFYWLYNTSNKEIGANVLSKQTSEHVKERGERIEFAIDISQSEFFGNIKYRESFGKYDARNRTALGNMLIEAGYPGLFLIFLIFIKFIPKLIRLTSMTKSRYFFLYIGFIAFFIGNFWYGYWISPFFIFYLAYICKVIDFEMIRQ